MIGDVCALALGLSVDCNENAIPDECELPSPDLNQDGVVDAADLAILLGASQAYKLSQVLVPERHYALDLVKLILRHDAIRKVLDSPWNW